MRSCAGSAAALATALATALSLSTATAVAVTDAIAAASPRSRAASPPSPGLVCRGGPVALHRGARQRAARVPLLRSTPLRSTEATRGSRPHAAQRQWRGACRAAVAGARVTSGRRTARTHTDARTHRGALEKAREREREREQTERKQTRVFRVHPAVSPLRSSRPPPPTAAVATETAAVCSGAAAAAKAPRAHTTERGE